MEPLAAVDRLRESGLIKTKGLIGGKWTDAYDGKTIEVNGSKLAFFLIFFFFQFSFLYALIFCMKVSRSSVFWYYNVVADEF